MKKILSISIIVFGFTAVLFFQSCSKDKNNDTQTTEYVADNSTFANFMSWPLESTKQGADPFLGPAHAGNDATVKREVYFKNGQDPVNGKYPVGTIVVKHSYNPDKTINEFTGMVKRGNNFNPNFGDWEFFMLTPTGSIATDASGIAMRGASLMGGMCAGCHTGASTKDFIFSK